MKSIWEYSNYFSEGQYKGSSSFTTQTRVLICKLFPPVPWTLSYILTPYICLGSPVSSVICHSSFLCWMIETCLRNRSTLSTSAIANSLTTASTGPQWHLSIILPSFTTFQKSALHRPLTSKRLMLLSPTSSEENNVIKHEGDGSHILSIVQELLIWKQFSPWIYPVSEQLLHLSFWSPLTILGTLLY